MAEIITFPSTKSERRSPVLPTFSFAADVHLVGGRNLAFSIKYPDGKIDWRLVAAMLRRVAATIEKPHQK